MKQINCFIAVIILLVGCLTACQPPESTQPMTASAELTPDVNQITPTVTSANITLTPTPQPSLTPEEIYTPALVEVTPIILFSGLPCPAGTTICDTEVFRDNKPIIYTVLSDGSELKTIDNSLFTFKDIPDLQHFTVFPNQSLVAYFDIKVGQWYVNNITDKSGLKTSIPDTSLTNYGVVFDINPECLLFYSKYPENNKIHIEKGCSTVEAVEQLPAFPIPPSIKLINPEVNLAHGGKHILLYGLDDQHHFYCFLMDAQNPDDEPILIYQENQPVQAVFQWMNDTQFNYLIASPTDSERVNKFFSYDVLSKELIDLPVEITLPTTPNQYSGFRLVKWLSNNEIIFAPESELPANISGLYFLDIKQNQIRSVQLNYMVTDIAVVTVQR